MILCARRRRATTSGPLESYPIASAATRVFPGDRVLIHARFVERHRRAQLLARRQVQRDQAGRNRPPLASSRTFTSSAADCTSDGRLAQGRPEPRSSCTLQFQQEVGAPGAPAGSASLSVSAFERLPSLQMALTWGAACRPSRRSFRWLGRTRGRRTGGRRAVLIAPWTGAIGYDEGARPAWTPTNPTPYPVEIDFIFPGRSVASAWARVAGQRLAGAEEELFALPNEGAR
jgi:hypothetical protein